MEGEGADPHISWRFQAWIDLHPLNKDTVLEYFSHSPFFDKTSVNALMKMQFLNNPARMLTVDGVQFVVVPNKHEPALFIIVKQIKKEELINRKSLYYCLEGTVYQAPTLYQVVRSRLLKCSMHLQNYFDEISQYTAFTTHEGYTWDFGDSSMAPALATLNKEELPLAKKRAQVYREQKEINKKYIDSICYSVGVEFNPASTLAAGEGLEDMRSVRSSKSVKSEVSKSGK